MIELYHAFAPVIPVFFLLFIGIVTMFLLLNRTRGNESNSLRPKMNLLLYIGGTVRVVGRLLVTLIPTQYPNQLPQLTPLLRIIETFQHAPPRAIFTSLFLNIVLFIPLVFFTYRMTRRAGLTDFLPLCFSVTSE